MSKSVLNARWENPKVYSPKGRKSKLVSAPKKVGNGRTPGRTEEGPKIQGEVLQKGTGEDGMYVVRCVCVVAES